MALPPASKVVGFLKGVLEFFQKPENKEAVVDIKGSEIAGDLTINNYNYNIKFDGLPSNFNPIIDAKSGELIALISKENKEIKVDNFLPETTKNDKLIILDEEFKDEYFNFYESFKIQDYDYAWLEKLDEETRRKIKLSKYIKSLYDSKEEKDKEKADREKQGLNEDDRRFCNLFTTGYISAALKYMNDIAFTDPNDVKTALGYLMDFKTIFFIHRGMDIIKIAGTVMQYIRKDNSPYLSLHAAGRNNTEILTEIVNLIAAATKEGYEIKNKRTEESETNNGIMKYSVFVFNKEGEQTYNDFTKGIFRKFI